MNVRQALKAVALVGALAGAAVATDPEGIEVTRYLPAFDTQKTLERLQDGLAPAADLDSALKTSTAAIWELIESYRETPTPELENRIYEAVAQTGELIVDNVNRLEGERDRLRDEMRELNHNVDAVVRNLGTYTETLDARAGDVVEEATALKDELKALARQLVEAPDDTAGREAFRAKVLELKRLRLKLRLYERNKAMYEKLAGQIGKVSRFFEDFEGRLGTVLDSLALQKRFIAMNLTVLRDKAKVVAWLRGEADGRSGVAGVMRQLADLSGSIKSFEKAMDVVMNLGGDFDDFAAMVPELVDPDLPGGAGVTDDELEDLIQAFARE